MIKAHQTRVIGTSRRALTGFVPVKGVCVPFESSLERDFLVLQDYNPNVSEVIAQPHKIQYIDDKKKKRRYTPDFLVRFDNSTEIVYEVKYREDFLTNFSDFKGRFKAARTFYKNHDVRFKLIDEIKIRNGTFWKNIQFLHAYQDLLSDVNFENRLIQCLKITGEIHPQGLLEFAFSSKLNRMKAIPFLWRLLANDYFQYCHNEPLTMYSAIWIDEKSSENE